MREKRKISENGEERGFVLVMSLCFLVIMSMLGIFATQISNIELQTSTNNEKFTTSFTLGEAVAVESVALLEREPLDNLRTHAPDLSGLPYEKWLDIHRYFEGNDYPLQPDYTQQAGWTSANESASPTAMDEPMDQGGILPPGFNALADLLHLAVQDTGRAAGFGISEGESEVRDYFLYGNYNVGRTAAFPGSVILEMGYSYRLQDDGSSEKMDAMDL